MNQSFYGWKLLAAVWVILALTMGFAVYGGTIMNTTMITEMHWDRKSLGLVAGSFALFLGLISPLTGFLVHKLGAKIAFSIGAVIVALGALAMATIVNSVVGAAIGFGLVMGSGTT